MSALVKALKPAVPVMRRLVGSDESMNVMEPTGSIVYLSDWEENGREWGREVKRVRKRSEESEEEKRRERGREWKRVRKRREESGGERKTVSGVMMSLVEELSCQNDSFRWVFFFLVKIK
jgi:hypothetical protein